MSAPDFVKENLKIAPNVYVGAFHDSAKYQCMYDHELGTEKCFGCLGEKYGAREGNAESIVSAVEKYSLPWLFQVSVEKYQKRNINADYLMQKILNTTRGHRLFMLLLWCSAYSNAKKLPTI